MGHRCLQKLSRNMSTLFFHRVSNGVEHLWTFFTRFVRAASQSRTYPASGPCFESLNIVVPAKAYLYVPRTITDRKCFQYVSFGSGPVHHSFTDNFAHLASEAGTYRLPNLFARVTVVQAFMHSCPGSRLSVVRVYPGSWAAATQFMEHVGTRTRRYLTTELTNYYIRLYRR